MAGMPSSGGARFSLPPVAASIATPAAQVPSSVQSFEAGQADVTPAVSVISPSALPEVAPLLPPSLPLNPVLLSNQVRKDFKTAKLLL